MARAKEKPPAAATARGSEIDFEQEQTSAIKPAKSRQPQGLEVRVGGCVLGQFGTPAKAPRQLSRVEIRLGRRRNELRKLAEDRAARRIPLTDPLGLALVLADIAAHSAAGLDERTFADAAIRARVTIPPDIAEQAIDRVQRAIVRKGGKYRPISGAAAGEAVRLLRDERIRLDIRTLAATDESPEERREFVRAGRKHRDRETKRIVRGRKPRSVFEAEGLAKSRPWIADGVSRATWFRRRQHRETRVSADNLSSCDERRHTCLTVCRSDEVQSASAALRAPRVALSVSPLPLRSSDGADPFIDAAPARRPLNVRFALSNAHPQEPLAFIGKEAAASGSVSSAYSKTENRKELAMSKTEKSPAAAAVAARTRATEALALARSGRPIAASLLLRPLVARPLGPFIPQAPRQAA